MKTIEERHAAIETELATIPRRGKFTSHFEREWREAALQFDSLKEHGFYMEDGVKIYPSAKERQEMADYFQRKIFARAVDLLTELGIETEATT